MKNKLKEIIVQGEVIEHAPMADYTSFRAGGRTDYLVIPANEEELKQCVAMLSRENWPFLVMGNGSNILVRDGGYRGVIIRMQNCCNEIVGEGPIFRVGASVLLSAAARHFKDRGYAGFEFASGIPGSIGGAAFMNAGAYGGEMKDIIRKVTLLRRDGGVLYELSGAEMDYGYRHSVLYDTGDIVLSVELELQEGNREDIAAVMRELAEKRNTKQPVAYPSAGSFFKRPTGYFAGKLIQDAGLKGLTVGGAQVSELHAGFVINKGGATSTDIERLMHLVQARVYEREGVMMEPEVRIIGEK